MRLKCTLAAFALAMTILAPIGAANANSVNEAPRGFAISTPHVEHSGETVSGAVCRRESAALRPNLVHVARIGADGAVVDEQTAPLHGALGAHSRGCAYYALHTGWTLAGGETVRATATSSLR